MDTLRRQLIRLAHEAPEHRARLLPFLAAEMDAPEVEVAIPSLYTATVRLAYGRPDLRPLLLPLIKEAREFTPREWKTYQKKHPGADIANHTIRKPHESRKVKERQLRREKKREDEKNKDSLLHDIKKSLTKDLGAVLAGGTKAIVDEVKKSPKVAKEFLTDEKARNKMLKGWVQKIKSAPGKLAKTIYDSAVVEVGEFKHAAKAVKKIIKKEKLTLKDKHAMYAVGVYAAGLTLAAVTTGSSLLATGAFGKSFGTHVAIKAAHALFDEGFLAFEGIETALHGGEKLLHFMSHLAADEDKDGQLLVQAMTGAVLSVLNKGISDEDIKKIMAGVELPEA